MALHCLSQPALLILWSPTAFKVGSPGHLEAAMAYVAVTMNLFGEDLYPRRGGSRKSEGDPWFCSCVGDVQFLKCAHACVCDVAMHVHDKFLLQEWANLEGGKLKLVAKHVINLTYRTINARPYVCASS